MATDNVTSRILFTSVFESFDEKGSRLQCLGGCSSCERRQEEREGEMLIQQLYIKINEMQYFVSVSVCVCVTGACFLDDKTSIGGKCACLFIPCFNFLLFAFLYLEIAIVGLEVCHGQFNIQTHWMLRLLPKYSGY